MKMWDHLIENRERKECFLIRDYQQRKQEFVYAMNNEASFELQFTTQLQGLIPSNQLVLGIILNYSVKPSFDTMNQCYI